jgi:hypothetical protein
VQQRIGEEQMTELIVHPRLRDAEPGQQHESDKDRHCGNKKNSDARPGCEGAKGATGTLQDFLQ